MIHFTSIDMRKYTANYTFTNPNFTIQNLGGTETDFAEKPLLFVLKNILQRGFPTMMSQYLQREIGAIHQEPDFKAPLLYIGTQAPRWVNTIKGDADNQYFPAKTFLEKLIPQYLGDFGFVQHLMLPEAEINEIVGEYNAAFVNQRVDFFLPQAKLVIEIDGQQHKADGLIDAHRDAYLLSKGIKTIRISTHQLGTLTFPPKRTELLDYLASCNGSLRLYQQAFVKSLKRAFSEKEIRTKLLPTAIIRFQILLIELLLNNYLNFGEPWKFNLIVREEEQLGDFAKLAIEDFFIWFSHLYRLQTKQEWNPPSYSIQSYPSRESCPVQSTVLNIDFSLFSRWTDEATLYPDAIFVRTDYYGAEKNHFQVSCAPAINYKITDEDKPTLEFFLQNLFDKPAFRDGQFPIIANILNREDTIGLLPTGGGKSLCYQLPCLLQPSVNFVVCPIKSLMYDQYVNLKNAYITNTQFITGDQSAEERTIAQREFANRKYLFIWISPERFQIKTFRAYLATVNASASVAHAVIDEVHGLSEWGHDFRTSYLNLAKTVEKYCPQAKFVGLTATASVNVLKDIRAEFARNNRVMHDENIKSLLDYSRKELTFHVIKDNNQKLDRLKTLLSQEDVLEQKQKAALVFTPHVNGRYGCHALTNQLNTATAGKAKWYSGEVPVIRLPNGNKVPVMPPDEFKVYKQTVQLDFKNDQFPLLVATKAFGMGIDKQNVHYTFHYGLPSSVEALYQEAGRAGRWDHRLLGMDKLKANCYVLYSPETVSQDTVNRLFDKDTSFTELKAITEDVGWDGKDVFRQIFMFFNGQLDPAEEYKIIQLILNNYFVAHSTQKIDFNTISNELRGLGFTGSNDSLCKLAQKAIYRLSVLGIVSDWTTNFTNHYEVDFQSMEDQDIFEALLKYLIKYQPDIKLSEELAKINRPSLRDRCVWYLLQWNFDNIIYNRKQTLKTLVEWCNEFENIGNESFKQRIDNYFRFTDTTFLFQAIAENPAVFSNWFEVFYRVDRDVQQQETKTYIPTISNLPARQAEFERLRDSLSRFLESYRNSPGLNLISGLIRLFLNDYENPDGRIRFESALSTIQSNFDAAAQQSILQELTKRALHMAESAQEAFYASVIKSYPDRAEALAEQLGLIYLLEDRISNKINQFKTLNNQLYAEFEQIGKI